MKKLKNKLMILLSMLLIAMLVFPFAACNNGENDGGGGNNNGGDTTGSEEYWVEKIEVTKGEGFQEEYTDGEAFNTHGLTVKAYWNDGYIEENVPSSSYYVTPGIVTEDLETVTVVYGDASFELAISSAHTVGIKVERMPTVTTYFEGEIFDPVGLVLCYVLDTGKTRAIKGYSVADVAFSDDPFVYGDNEAIVSYGGYSCGVPVSVKGSGFKIEVNTSPNCTMSGTTGYKAGSNVKLKELASNGDFMQDFKVGSIMTFTFESDTPQINLLFQGSSTYVTKYGSGSDKWNPISVEDMQVSRVFDMKVNGVDVPIDDDAILNGIASEDGTTADVTYLANWTEVNLGIIDVYTKIENVVELTFKDNGYENALTSGSPEGSKGAMPAPFIDYILVSNIKDERVERIEVTAPPSKLTYVEGQTFDPAGMEVTAHNKDGTSAVVSEFKIKPTGALTTLGKNDITVNYNGYTTIVEVTVIEKVITGIEITKSPTKTVYSAGQTFDPAGMEVTATYNDGATAVISDYDWSPKTALGIENTTITVTAGNETDTCTISVTSEDLFQFISISGISSEPLKEGDILPVIEPATVVVTANYASGKTVVLGADEYDVAVDSGAAVLGSGVTVTLKSDSDVTAKWLFNVSKTIDTKKDNVITESTEKIYRNDAKWHNGAIDGDFIQNAIGDVTIKYTFESSADGKANLVLSGSSGHVTSYTGSLPKEKGDMQANLMFDLYVNGTKVEMTDDVLFKGGIYETARNENLADWHLIELAEILLQAGENTVELRFKEFEYRNNANGNPLAKPYIDYLVISTT